MDRAELFALVTRCNPAQASVWRARIVLACAGGRQNKNGAARLDFDAANAAEWRRRFAAQRSEGPWDDPRPGAPRGVDDGWNGR